MGAAGSKLTEVNTANRISSSAAKISRAFRFMVEAIPNLILFRVRCKISRHEYNMSRCDLILRRMGFSIEA